MDAIAPTGKVTTFLAKLNDALEAQDADAAAALFATECYWRDLVALTWNIKTMEGRDAIAEMLRATLGSARPRHLTLDGDATEAGGVSEGWFTFETETGRGRGHLRLNGEGCWTLLTTLQELKGFEEPKGPARPRGVEHGVQPGRKSYAERMEEERRELGYSRQPEVVIIGGGQGGIALGARLRRLGVPTIILEKNERAGDSWRKRYKSLCLHDPVWYDHLPYLPFPDHWPVFAPKDKLGDWLESYTKIMELNYWTRSTAQSARWDEAAGEWVIEVEREGRPVTLRPKQLVLATGMSGVPNMPKIPGMESFKGDIHHSSRHPGPDGFKGKKVVVIGSNNSSHDICAALWEAGVDVTMLQRSSTHIVKSDTLMELALGALYSEEAVANGIDVNTADLIFASIPYKVLPAIQKPQCDETKKRDADFYRRLENAGFMLDFGADETGLFLKYLRRGSGYYIDVGASDLVANGSIKLRTGEIDRITENAVVMKDGTELPADVIVCATGYGSMNGWAAQLISQEVADRVGKCWGLGSDTPKDPGPWEGELRNMWKPTQVDNLWFHGGNLHQSRHYSQFLALQLKARAEGLATPVYGLAQVHHTG
ncbi:flavin-containing monooxygenase [Rubrimonas cliftonensis]|uniref:Putative flavoprotein involved in K+ transport n=1 Tax=Rubrimonas cliftonensis TaxID=89524 RepID=A0A1H3VU31_9RHOB|nr:NAD(P)/FAD-dependent oxidoreductase [Rubrimonas cliftonensis]SDZ77608.1 putative flavoprotein involved in K+ transport [Rubrimonas cliftonensis]